MISPGAYLAPVVVENGWTSALFSPDGELLAEYGLAATKADALFCCKILSERFGCQVPS